MSLWSAVFVPENIYGDAIGDCAVVSFDLHHEIDALGSASEYTKAA